MLIPEADHWQTLGDGTGYGTEVATDTCNSDPVKKRVKMKFREKVSAQWTNDNFFKDT